MVKEKRPYSLSVINQKRNIFFVQATYAKGPAWYYIQVIPAKLPLFKKRLGKAGISVADYGKVLLSGWGTEPPLFARQEIERIIATESQ